MEKQRKKRRGPYKKPAKVYSSNLNSPEINDNLSFLENLTDVEPCSLRDINSDVEQVSHYGCRRQRTSTRTDVRLSADTTLTSSDLESHPPDVHEMIPSPESINHNPGSVSTLCY